MSLASYPAGLPRPETDGYALQRTNNTLRSAADSGRAAQRTRFARVPTELAASFRCSAAEAVLLESFVADTLHDGAAWFLLDILTPAGLVAHRVRFISDPRDDCTPQGTAAWDYRCRIEVYALATLGEEQTAAALTAPNTIEEFVTGVDNAVDSYEE